MQFSPPTPPRIAGDIRPRSQALRTAAAAARAATCMRILRRLHLYSGLLLLPFTLVYGISGFLFNHAGGAADAPLAVPDTARESLPRDAAALALRAQGQLSQRDREAGVEAAGAAVAAELVGSWTFEWKNGDARRILRLAADGSAASIRDAGAGGRARGTPLPRDLFADELDAARRAAHEAIAASGGTVAELRCTGAPTLRYETVAADGTPCEVRIALDRATAAVAAPAPLGVGRFLQRLHTAHGYGRSAARSAWAVVVDAMALAMVLWSVSGLAMWWQKRSHRRVGLLALGVAAASAGVLGLAMHTVFTA